ncbi:MAG: hypothetical protein FWH04_01605 [Oscillospiraceae bacterium]|nr:hypothetical protein [Oscillospiraceae bacterium]
MTPKKNSNMMDALSKMGLVEKREEAGGTSVPVGSGTTVPSPDSPGGFGQLLEQYEAQEASYAPEEPYISPEDLYARAEEVAPETEFVQPPAEYPDTSAYVAEGTTNTPDGYAESYDDSISGSSSESDMFFNQPPSGPSVTDIDRYVDLDELYRSFNMKLSGVDTIYLIESYIKTLPDTLPSELRRSIILQIVETSGFNFEALLNDGIDRVSRLNEYSSSFASRTEEVVERHNVEIDALERQIQQIRELINERKNLHKRQFLAIESEGRRLKDVLDFITK